VIDPVKRTVGLLSLCQATFNTGQAMLMLTAGLVGYQLLGENPTLATAPISTMVVGTALATIPAALLMGRFGRRNGFSIGNGVAMLGAVIAAISLSIGGTTGFAGFGVATFCLGCANGFAQHYRLAAADVASGAFKPKAISLVLAGGVVAAFLGPEIVVRTAEIVPETRFLGTFFALVVVQFVSLALIRTLDLPRPTAAEMREPPRPLGAIVRQPTYVVAALSSMIGFALMSLLMTATPIAMVEQFHHALDDTKIVIQWHAFAMFAPSFFTGFIIARFGVLNVILAGIVFMIGAVGFAATDTSVLHFWMAMFLLGLGWNFMFVGGSTLLTETYRTSERPKAQAFHDFVVFGLVALASLSSGALLQFVSWHAVSLGAIPFLVVVTLATVWLALRRRTQASLA
jgi:MFS family permease